MELLVVGMVMVFVTVMMSMLAFTDSNGERKLTRWERLVTEVEIDVENHKQWKKELEARTVRYFPWDKK